MRFALLAIALLVCSSQVTAGPERPAQIDPQSFNKRIATATDCFFWHRFSRQKPQPHPSCKDPDEIFEVHADRIRKPSKRQVSQGIGFEIRTSRPKSWKPILPGHDVVHALIDWLPELGCFYGVAYWEGGAGFFLLYAVDGELIKLGQGPPVLSPDGGWLTTTGINAYGGPYDKPTIKVFKLTDGVLNPKPVFESRNRLNVPCVDQYSYELRWDDERRLSIDYKLEAKRITSHQHGGRVSAFSHQLDFAESGTKVTLLYGPETMVGTNKPAVTIRAAPGTDAKPLAIVPFATQLEVVSNQGQWIEVEFEQDRTGFVFGPLVDLFVAGSVFGPLCLNRTSLQEKELESWHALQKERSPTGALVKKTRDEIEVAAYEKPDEIPEEVRAWFYRMAFVGSKDLPPVYDRTPNTLLRSSPAFGPWFMAGLFCYDIFRSPATERYFKLGLRVTTADGDLPLSPTYTYDCRGAVENRPPKRAACEWERTPGYAYGPHRDYMYCPKDAIRTQANPMGGKVRRRCEPDSDTIKRCYERVGWEQQLQEVLGRMDWHYAKSVGPADLVRLAREVRYVLKGAGQYRVFRPLQAKEFFTMLSDERFPALYAWAMSNYKAVFIRIPASHQKKYVELIRVAIEYLEHLDVKTEENYLQSLKAKGRPDDFIVKGPDGKPDPLRRFKTFLFRRIRQGAPLDKLVQLLSWLLEDLGAMAND